MIVTVVALLALDRIEYRLYREETPRKAALWLLLTRIAFIEVLSWLDEFRYSPFLYLVVLFLACLYFGEVTGYGLAVVIWIVYFVKHMYYSAGWLSDGTQLHYLVLFTIAVALMITIARVVAKEKASRLRAEELLTELEESHQQLKDYAEQVEELATTRERNRLARDIHDSLGHYLTIINVQLEKALTFWDRNWEEAEQAVYDAKHLAKEALQDVRRSVSTLRATQEVFAFTPTLTELVERIQSSQLSVELRIEGSEEGYAGPALMTLYRAVQEGLTNIQKHAGASAAQVEIHFGDSFATLRLTDNGCGFEPKMLATLAPDLDTRHIRGGSSREMPLHRRSAISGMAAWPRKARGPTTIQARAAFR